MTRKRIPFGLACGPLACLAVALLLGAKKPAPTSFEALVVKVDGSTLVLQAADQKHFTAARVDTDAKTEVLVNGAAAKLTDLTPGQLVVVSPPKGKARQVEAKAPRTGKCVESGVMDGSVVSADPSNVVFLSPMTNGEIVQVTAPIGEKTSILVDQKPAGASDLKRGQSAVLVFVGGNLRRIAVQPQGAGE